MRADLLFWRIAGPAFFLYALATLCVIEGAAGSVPPPASASNEAQRVRWVPVTVAQLKIDGKTPLKWNVFWPEKTDKRKGPAIVLILLGRRYIALDIKGKVAYSVLPTDLQAQGANFESADLAVSGRQIPSSDWSVRDVGPAELIRLTLGDYGREIEVQLPHPPDLRWAY